MENNQELTELTEEMLTKAAGGTFSDFVGMRKDMEQFCAMLQIQSNKRSGDGAHAAHILEYLHAAMENEPQCIYFLQQANQEAQQLQNVTLKNAVLKKLENWCDLIYE